MHCQTDSECPAFRVLQARYEMQPVEASYLVGNTESPDFQVPPASMSPIIEQEIREMKKAQIKLGV